MGKGSVYPPEGKTYRDRRSGALIRQVTSHPSIHHHPFFFVPAWDGAMSRLYFVSHRTGRPEIYAELRASGEIVQLTERAGLAEWSVYPSHDGRYVYFTAGTGVWRLHVESGAEEQLAEFGDVEMREKGMVGAAMGTTALSWCDRWWAVPFKAGQVFRLMMIDTVTGRGEVVLERETIGHPQFCPDDSDLLFCAGPLTDRIWVVRRDGSGHRRLYLRQGDEWITHESWIPGRRELAFIDWPNGIRCVHVDTGRERRVTSFNAWHAVCNRQGTLMVADTNFPDIGLQLFDPLDGEGRPRTLCYPEASSIGEHWDGPFPYGKGPRQVYAPQHTHPHPSFSPDGRRVVYTSDRSGFAQVYDVIVPEEPVLLG